MSQGWNSVAVSPMRVAIARRMVHSKQVAPHFYVSVDLDTTAVLDAAARHNAGRAPDERVTVTAYLLRALATRLAGHEPRPVVIDGAVAIRPKLTATLSADHRVVDGASAAAFLADLRASIEAAADWKDPA